MLVGAAAPPGHPPTGLEPAGPALALILSPNGRCGLADADPQHLLPWRNSVVPPLSQHLSSRLSGSSGRCSVQSPQTGAAGQPGWGTVVLERGRRRRRRHRAWQAIPTRVVQACLGRVPFTCGVLDNPVDRSDVRGPCTPTRLEPAARVAWSAPDPRPAHPFLGDHPEPLPSLKLILASSHDPRVVQRCRFLKKALGAPCV